MKVKVKLDRAAVRKLSMDIGEDACRPLAELILRDGRMMVRVKSGAVRGGLYMRRTRNNGRRTTYLVGGNHPRTLLEHQGAEGHPIEPRRVGGMLKFFWKKRGRVVYLPYVNHPGTRGSKFLTTPMVLHRVAARVPLDLGAGEDPARMRV